ncbi:MAG TPA: glycosyltransferase family 2 protein [Paludibacter sp.]|nr:glycosyltransferase family 2 protein [Paludibacter sp.]
MTISVIIPVFKVEQYLDECIQSVFCQTYRNLEIILVNDGSPDNCPAMCEGYVLQDKRVRVIHKENGGLSDARNAGLLAATGEYVIFLDSDDFWLDNGFLAILIDEIKIQQNVDLILFGRKDYYEATGNYVNGLTVDVEKVNGCKKTDVFQYLVVNQLYSMSAWSKIIRRKFLIGNEIFFEKGLLGEDMDWSLKLWAKLDSVRAVNCQGYAYRHRPQSITSTYGLKNVADFVGILEKWKKIAQDEMQGQELGRLFLGYLAFLYPTLLRNFYLTRKTDRKIEYRMLKELIPLLQHSITTKSDQVALLNRYAGFGVTVFVFGVFGLIKKRGIKGLALLIK